MKTVLSMGATLLLPLASMCLGQDMPRFDAKTGLWEATTTMEMEMPGRQMPTIPPEKLAQMPPEARARVEAAMKTAGGAPTTTVTKSCVTKESLDRGSGFAGSRESSCTRKIVSQTAAKMQVHMECPAERGRPETVGDVYVERVDGEHVKTSMVLKASGDHPMNMKINSNSRWIGADCGDVKPILPK